MEVALYLSTFCISEDAVIKVGEKVGVRLWVRLVHLGNLQQIIAEDTLLPRCFHASHWLGLEADDLAPSLLLSNGVSGVRGTGGCLCKIQDEQTATGCPHRLCLGAIFGLP